MVISEFPVHAAVPILVAAGFLLAIALLLPLVVLIMRRVMPPEPKVVPVTTAVPCLPQPARTRPVAIIAASQLLRAPPTFPAKPRLLTPHPSSRE